MLLFQETLSYLLRGALVSLQIAGIACLIGLFLGTVLALTHTSSSKFFRFLTSVYVTIIRGTPMLVQIMIIFYMLPAMGLRLTAFWSATFAIGLNSSAYLSQIIRSGIMSISKGQWEAAHVLGFSRWQTLRLIVLPQAFRVIIPGLGNELVTLLKDSSLASTIGVVELVKEGTLVVSRTYEVIPVYCMITVLYLVMTSCLSLVLMLVEKRMKRNACH